jgi:hypothetical protein
LSSYLEHLWGIQSSIHCVLVKHKACFNLVQQLWTGGIWSPIKKHERYISYIVKHTSFVQVFLCME